MLMCSSQCRDNPPPPLCLGGFFLPIYSPLNSAFALKRSPAAMVTPSGGHCSTGIRKCLPLAAEIVVFFIPLRLQRRHKRSGRNMTSITQANPVAKIPDAGSTSTLAATFPSRALRQATPSNLNIITGARTTVR